MKRTRNRLYRLIGILLTAILWMGGAAAQLNVDQPQAETRLDTQVHQVAWNPAGTALAVASEGGLMIYSADLQLLTQQHADKTVYSVAWHPTGDQVALTQGQVIEIWDWDGQDLTLDHTLTGSQTQLLVAWSPDGAYLASADGSELELGWVTTIRFWNPTTWEVVATAPEIYFIFNRFPFANQMMWNPTGRPELIMMGDTAVVENGQYFVDTVKRFNFIDPATGHLTRYLPYTRFSTAAAWHPDGEWIALGTEGLATLHNIVTDDFKPALGVGDGFNIGFYRILVMDWSHDGRYLATNDAVYDFEQSSYLGDFQRDTLDLQAVAWHPDNVRLATADSTGRLKVEAASVLQHFVHPVQAVTDFILVDADADEDIRTLSDGDTISEGTFTIRVETEPAIVGSVVFGLDDEPRFKVENEDAYALKGDDNGDYHAWLAEPGTYTLTATPYTEADGQGEAGTPLTITFTVEAPGS